VALASAFAERKSEMFGLDLKSVIVGILIAMFVIPWVTGMLNRPKAATPAA